MDSLVSPTLQIDVAHDVHQKLYRAATKITQGANQNNELAIFDDTRGHFFKELLPYWSGFKFACTINPNDGSITFPLTKQERMLRERLEEFINMRKPSASDFKLPLLMGPTATGGGGGGGGGRRANTPGGGSDKAHRPNTNIVFSIASGIRFKDDRDSHIGNHKLAVGAAPAAANTITSGSNMGSRPPTVTLMTNLRSSSLSNRRSSNTVNVK